MSNKASIPETGFLRLSQILGDKNNPPIIPVSKSTWFAGIKNGRFPKSVKLGPRTSAWRTEDLRALINAISQSQNNWKM